MADWNDNLTSLFKKETFGEVLRFGIVGVVAVALHFSIYWILQHWINVNIAYTVGYVLSFFVNYYLSAHFTFKEKTSKENGAGFVFAHVFNYFLQLGLFNFFYWIGVPAELAPLPVYFIAVPVSFLLVRFALKKK